jgi:AcrR family transcriptional regulator
MGAGSTSDDQLFQRARTPEQQEQRRQAILAAAREMLDEMPLADISLRELSRRVGLAKSNVVRYFPTREAVFLAVLVDDWADWLDTLEDRLPRPHTRRSSGRTHALLGTAIAETLAAQPRMCQLIATAQTILEHNLPVDTAREFKAAARDRTLRLSELARKVEPALDDRQAFEFAGMTWALLAGVWPMANPSPTVATVLEEPEFAGMCVDFVPVFGRALATVLDGMTADR